MISLYTFKLKTNLILILSFKKKVRTLLDDVSQATQKFRYNISRANYSPDPIYAAATRSHPVQFQRCWTLLVL